MKYVSHFKTLFTICNVKLVKKYRNDFKKKGKKFRENLYKTIEFELVLYWKNKKETNKKFTIIDVCLTFQGDTSYYMNKFPDDYEKYQYCYLTGKQRRNIPTPLSGVRLKMFSNKWNIFTSHFAYYNDKFSIHFLSNEINGYMYHTNFFKRLLEFLNIIKLYHGQIIRIFWWRNVNKIKEINRKMCEDSARRSRLFNR